MLNLREKLRKKQTKPATVAKVDFAIVESANSMVEENKKQEENKEAKQVKPEPVKKVEELKEHQVYLTAHEQKFKIFLLEKMYEILDLSMLGKLERSDANKQIQEVTYRIIQTENLPLNAESRHKLVQIIEDEILGLGPIESILRDKSISDIMINGPKCIYVEKGGCLQLSSVIFDSEEHLMKIIDRIVSPIGRRVDESVPLVDARLKDGSRVNVVVPPLSLNGPAVSIRRFPEDPLKLMDLVEFNALSNGMAEFLKGAVISGKNIIISGGTGSGKTTTLNALSGYIPVNERIVTIEDAAELQLQQPHVVVLETRPASIEGTGEITARDLVKNSLRMRPDRIVVGEVRGEEALDMLQAMNTGHDGSLTTVHANTARDALTRIENMVAMGGYDLPAKAVRSQIASGIDLVIQVQRLEDGSRKMLSISEVVGMEGEIVTMSDIFIFRRDGLDEQGKVIGQFTPTGAIPTFMDELVRKGININMDIFDPDLV